MVEADCASPPESPTDLDAQKHRRTFLHRLRPKKIHPVAAPDQRRSSLNTHFSSSTPSLISQPHGATIRGGGSDGMIAEAFAALYEAIIAHVHKYYSLEQVDKDAAQGAIEHATYGLGIPWPQVVALLSDQTTRLGALTMCIGWTILSRSLLLRLGMSNSPGSTFLPPEIVECFQSFTLENGAVVHEKGDKSQMNLALLSRWKQISAALMHKAYVTHSFTHFDSRTANIERALKDLEPLLQTYASPHSSLDRINDMRDVLRTGANFAFVVFSQPCFWEFDWCGPQHYHERVEHQIGVYLERGSFESHLNPADVVIWPTMMRIMDSDGRKIGQRTGGDMIEGHVLGKKLFLTDFQ